MSQRDVRAFQACLNVFDAKRTETELLELAGAWRPVGR